MFLKNILSPHNNFSPLIKYIADVLNHRSGADNVDKLDGIDDTRNGLLLLCSLCRQFEFGALVFLKVSCRLLSNCFVSFCETKYPKTSNFFISIDDIPYNPLAPRQENRTSQTSHLMLQYINDSSLGLLLPATIPSNSDLREPRDIVNWPPAVVLDIAYASAALRAWAPESFIQTVRAMVKDIYYKASPDNDHTLTPCEAQKQLLDARNKKKA